MEAMAYRLTQYAHGGGCACKIPPGELEAVVRGLTKAAPRDPVGELLVGLDDGDDAAAVRIDGGTGRLADRDHGLLHAGGRRRLRLGPDRGGERALRCLRDGRTAGGRGQPAGLAPRRAAAGAGGRGAARRAGRGGEAGCHLAGGHSVDDPEPKYGLAVTGIADPNRLLRNDAGKPGTPLSLTKPLGVGVLNSRHKSTGEVFPQAIEAMTTLNAAARRCRAGGWCRCATDVTGFGLLGHLYKLARASGVTAVIDSSAVPYLDGAREALAAGYVSGGTRRNLDWVAPHVDLSAVDEDEALLLADAQTSGGLLVAGEMPGAPVIGELVAARGAHHRRAVNPGRPEPTRQKVPSIFRISTTATRWDAPFCPPISEKVAHLLRHIPSSPTLSLKRWQRVRCSSPLTQFVH